MKHGHSGLYDNPELGSKVAAYAQAHSTPVPAHITAHHESMSSHKYSIMLTSDFQSQMHLLLAKSINAKRVLEIGVFLGYSAMVWSEAVGPDGLVTGLEYSAEFAAVAQKGFDDNNITNVDLILGPAAETLPKLSPPEPYDLVFLDADKVGYQGYVSELLAKSQPGSPKRLLRPGALILADNVLQEGEAAKDGEASNDIVQAVRDFNQFCLKEKRLQTVLLPLWDGLTVARVID